MPNEQTKDLGESASTHYDASSAVPTIFLPKGGGAICGIGEKFSANPVTGTASLSVPVFTTPSRSDFYPKLALSYDSGSPNGPVGFGWSLSLRAITRKPEKGLSRYADAEDLDMFIQKGESRPLYKIFLKKSYA